MTIQRIKIESRTSKGQWFFSDRAFETAEQQADAFLDRNGPDHTVYVRNLTPYGPTWVVVPRSHITNNTKLGTGDTLTEQLNNIGSRIDLDNSALLAEINQLVDAGDNNSAKEKLLVLAVAEDKDHEETSLSRYIRNVAHNI